MRRIACTLAVSSALFVPMLVEAKPKLAASKPGPTDLVVTKVDAEALYPSGRVRSCSLYDFWSARENPQAPQPRLLVRVNLRGQTYGVPPGRRLVLDLAFNAEADPFGKRPGKGVPVARHEVWLDDQQTQDYLWQLDPTGLNIGNGEEFCSELLITARVEGQSFASQKTVSLGGGPCGD